MQEQSRLNLEPEAEKGEGRKERIVIIAAIITIMIIFPAVWAKANLAGMEGEEEELNCGGGGMKNGEKMKLSFFSFPC